MNTRGKSLYLGVVAVLGIVGLMGSTSLANNPISPYVGQVELDLGTPNQSGLGGEFTARLKYDSTVLALLGPSVANQFSPVELSGAGANNQSSPTAVFETFCIEEGVNDVTFSPGHQYYAATVGPMDGLPQIVDPRAAYLFNLFWQGNLGGYNFNNTGPGLSRQLDAGALQAAIWVLEGDNTMDGTGAGGNGINHGAEDDAGITTSTLGSSPSAQAMSAQAIAQANAWVALGNSHSGDSTPQVQVFGMYDTETDAGLRTTQGLAQAQLVEIPNDGGSNNVIPTPLPAAAGVGFGMLGGFGMLAGLRKRLRRQPRIAG